MTGFKQFCIGMLLSIGMSCPRADDDVEKARRLHTSGTILSLEHMVREARKIRPGRVIEAELEYEDSHQRYVYEVEILDEHGRIWEVEFDAATGEIIEHEPEDH